MSIKKVLNELTKPKETKSSEPEVIELVRGAEDVRLKDDKPRYHRTPVKKKKKDKMHLSLFIFGIVLMTLLQLIPYFGKDITDTKALAFGHFAIYLVAISFYLTLFFWAYRAAGFKVAMGYIGTVTAVSLFFYYAPTIGHYIEYHYGSVEAGRTAVFGSLGLGVLAFIYIVFKKD